MAKSKTIVVLSIMLVTVLAEPPSSQYGAPGGGRGAPSSDYGTPSGDYGGPNQQPNPSSQYGAPSSQYGAPSSQYGAPSSQYGAPSNKYGAPSSQYGAPSSQYGAPSNKYGAPSNKYGAPSSQYGAPSNKYGPPSNGYENNEPANYEFQYDVDAPEYEVKFGHRENRKGEVAQGSYYVLLPDGRTQRVEYVADENGYRPKITYEGGNGGYGRGPQRGGY